MKFASGGRPWARPSLAWALLGALAAHGACWLWIVGQPSPSRTAQASVTLHLRTLRPAMTAAPPLSEGAPLAAPEKAMSPVAAMQPADETPDALSQPAAVPRPQSAGQQALEPQAGPSQLVEPESWPLYAASPPVGLRAHYTVELGGQMGLGMVHWEPQPDARQSSGSAPYRLSWRLEWAGRRVSERQSQGWWGAYGLAPERQLERLGRGAPRAINFQAEQGQISFSNSRAPLAYTEGVQDRLSWWVQLPAVVEANPQLRAPGARVVLRVVGPDGGSSSWVFQCLGVEWIDGQEGRVAALRWRREPWQEHGSEVDAWLDPQRQHWPIKLKLSSGPRGQAMVWTLNQIQTLAPEVGAGP